MMNWLKKLMLFRVLTLAIQLKKTDYNTKINEIKNKINDHDHGKYITIQEFISLKSQHIAARLKQANLANKNDISDFINSFDLDKKVEKLATKTELKAEQDKIEKLQTYEVFVSYWWITKFLNISTNFQHFHNASLSQRHSQNGNLGVVERKN